MMKIVTTEHHSITVHLPDGSTKSWESDVKVTTTEREDMELEQTNLKQAALDWVNSVREEYGLKALSELPKGRAGESFDCVLIRAVSDITDRSCSWVGEKRRSIGEGDPMILRFAREGRIVERPVPATAVEFVRRFDQGEFPELIG